MALLELVRTQPPSSLSALPEGAAGIRHTLDRMIEQARIGSTTLEIRSLAERIIAGVGSKDFDGEISAIQHWVRNNIRYTRDPVTAEMLKDPIELLANPSGDCDDQATLVGALAMSIGFPVRFVAIGLYTPGAFDHVYAEVKLGTVWVSVETTEPVSIGWQPPENEVLARMVRHA